MDASLKVFAHFERNIMVDRFKCWLQSNLDYFMEEETEFVNYGDVAREAKNTGHYLLFGYVVIILAIVYKKSFWREFWYRLEDYISDYSLLLYNFAEGHSLNNIKQISLFIFSLVNGFLPTY